VAGWRAGFVGWENGEGRSCRFPCCACCLTRYLLVLVLYSYVNPSIQCNNNDHFSAESLGTSWEEFLGFQIW
jgi:hypothetical protein